MFSRAPVTFAIAAVTIAASVVLFALGIVDLATLYAGFIPLRFSAGPTFLDGVVLLPAVLTPFSATLIHANLIHLLFNGVMLVFAGMATERALGSAGVAVLYGVGAIASAAAHLLLNAGSPVPLIGASGAVSALVGAYSLLYGRSRARAIGPLSAQAVHVLWLIAAWTAINALVGLMSAGTAMPIAAAAHVGGFVAGIALCRPLLRWHWREA